MGWRPLAGLAEELGVGDTAAHGRPSQPGRMGGRQSLSEPWLTWGYPFSFLPWPLENSSWSLTPRLPPAIRQGSSSHFRNNKGFYRVI